MSTTRPCGPESASACSRIAVPTSPVSVRARRDLHRSRHLDKRRAGIEHLPLERARKGCRHVDRYVGVRRQEGAQPSRMVTMRVRQHHDVHVGRGNAQLVHIAQQHRAVAPGIEENRRFEAFDQTGEAPGGLDPGDTWIVVEEHVNVKGPVVLGVEVAVPVGRGVGVGEGTVGDGVGNAVARAGNGVAVAVDTGVGDADGVEAVACVASGDGEPSRPLAPGAAAAQPEMTSPINASTANSLP